MSGASLSRDRAGGGQANTHNSPMLRKFSETHLLPQRVVLFGGRLIETRNWDGAENALRPEGAAQQQAQRGKHVRSAADALCLHSTCYHPCRGIAQELRMQQELGACAWRT